jgi:hypothetical protein
MTIRLLPVKKLGASHDHEDETECECEPDEQAGYSVRKVGRSAPDRRRERRAEADERAGEHGQDEEVERGHACLRHSDRLGLVCHVRRRKCVEPGRRERRLGRRHCA